MNTAIIGRAFSLAYRELVKERSRQQPFWVLVGFLPMFIIERTLAHHYPDLFIKVHGLHVHRFTWGVLVLAIVGFISIVAQNPPARRWPSFMALAWPWPSTNSACGCVLPTNIISTLPKT